MLPGRRTADGALFVTQGPPPTGTPLVGGIAVRADGTIYVSQSVAPVFSPLDLFSAGEQGVWYDPSDLTTMFQDSAGTMPVTADGQPVGLILDKSGRNNHASQATAANRPLYKTSGGLHWLQFDGVDDALATASIDFTATDKMSAFSGCSVNNVTTSTGVIYEFGQDPATTNNSFGLLCGGAAFGDVRFSARTTTTTIRTSTGKLAVSTPTVLSNAFDMSNPASSIPVFRKDGADFTNTITGTHTVGSAFGNYPLYVSSRINTTLYLVGRIYSLIVLGRLATTQEITDTETWVNSKTGAY